MAIGSPFHERSWSPAGGSPEPAPVEHESRGSGHRAPPQGMLDLSLARAAIEDGLLMVFGPEGDPVPPQVFGAAAAAQPHAAVPLAEGPPVPAERIAVVLEAQLTGRSGDGAEGTEAWIRAMLGIGPQPEMVQEDDLLAEGCTVEVVAFGRELMLTSPSGATFLLAEARSPTPLLLRVPGDGPASIGGLVGQLLAGADRGDADPSAEEFAAPACRAWLEDDALRIDLPGIGVVELARAGDDAIAAPSVSLFMASGEVATIDDLLRALSGPAALTSVNGEAGPLDPALPPLDADAQRRRSVPLMLGLPDALAHAPERVALLVVRGLPEGATMSAGIASVDGSWLLSPRDLPGLSINPLPDCSGELALDITAIAIAGPEGELTSAAATVFVPLPSAPLEPERTAMVDASPSPEIGPAPPVVEAAPAPGDERAHAAIPLGLDPQDLSGGGAFDAVIVRDVPAGAALSAGTYDPAIAAWVLLPHQLRGLSVLRDAGAGEDFTLSLLGVSLRPGGGARPRVLARVPVSAA
jgi:hypothetical protein